MRRCMQDECNNEADCREVDKKKEGERKRENDMIQSRRRIIDARYICKFGTWNFITGPPTPFSCNVTSSHARGANYNKFVRKL